VVGGAVSGGADVESIGSPRGWAALGWAGFVKAAVWAPIDWANFVGLAGWMFVGLGSLGALGL
jgi:hypothetical protein